jgi:Flp pilus assembly protein TadD
MTGMRRGYLAAAWAVFLSTLAVYTLTVTTSIPFWDSGEFIATSYILGIPHPPGTPLYVLIGRLFTLLPLGNVSLQVNWLSSVASALAALFTFLVTVRLVRLCQTRAHLGQDRTTTDEIIAWTAGATAAFFCAFSNTFWGSAIEAEVYALSSMVQIASVYLALRWWEELGNDGGDGRLLLAWYLMCLCIGIHLGTFLVAPAVVLLALLVNPRSILNLKFIGMAVVLLVVGVSVHYYLMIRASLNPAINEGDPETWDAMMYLLQRKQYGSRPMFPRSADLWTFQIPMFWGYFMDQYRLWRAEHAFPSVLPLALGLYGAAMQFVREKKTFLMMFVLFGITSFGLIMYLNFTDREVRERDYFYTSAFHFFSIWIGMGLGFVLELVRDSLRGRATAGAGATAGGPAPSSVATTGPAAPPPGALAPERVHPFLAAACALAVGISWLPAWSTWFEHDRTDFTIAADYAHNMLAPLGERAFVFTNGDNDTFPLWCLQEVNGFRKDVRVINLSLLNTDWYIRQLRDEEPRVPMNVEDSVLDIVRTHGYLTDASGQPEQVSAWMVRNILAANLAAGVDQRPAYLAVTVPNHMGLDPRMTLEGLVYRVHDDSTSARIDTTLVRKNLYEVFKYDNLYTADGTFLPVPFKDENAYRLTQNYAAAHLQLGFRYRLDGRRDEAIRELERVLRMYPSFPAARPALGMFYLENGDTTRALAFFEESRREAPGDKDLAYYHAVTLGLSGQVDAALARFKEAIALDPDDGQSYFAAYSIARDAGRLDEAAGVLRQWVGRHPDDPQAAMMLRELEAQLRGEAPPAAGEVPPPGSIAPLGGPGGVPGGPGGTN